MALTKYIQNTFAGGIMSERYDGRTDWQQYYNSVKEGMNVVFHPTGGVSNRFGSIFLGYAKYSDRACRIIPFRFSLDEQYLIEIGDEYMRFWKNDRLLTVAGMAYEIYSPYKEADLKQLKWVQSADVVYLLHKNYPPKELRRYGDTDWRIVNFDFVNGPFQEWNQDKTLTMELYWNSGANMYALSCNDWYFKTGMEGSLFKITKNIKGTNIYRSMNFTGTVGEILSNGNYKVITTGGWQGTLILEKSTDRVVWSEVQTWVSPTTTSPQNINIVSEIDNENIAWYRLKFTYTAGTINVTFSCDTFNYDFICQIISMQSDSGGMPDHYGEYKRANVELLNGAVGLNTYFGNVQDDIKVVVPVMTSNTAPSGTASGSMQGIVLSDAWKIWNPAGFGSSPTGFWAEANYATWTMSFRYDFASGQEKYISKLKPFNREVYYTFGMPQLIYVDIYSTDNTTARIAVTDWSWGKEISVPTTKVKSISVTFTNFTKGYAGTYSFFVSYINVYGYDALPATLAVSEWAEGAWSGYRGYPSTGAFYQDRLSLAANGYQPYTLWMSKTGIYNDFGISNPKEDSDTISVNMPSPKRDLPDINHLVAVSKLLVFSASSESAVSIYPTLSQDYQGQRGSNNCVPVVVGNTVLYVTQQGGSLRDFFYDFAGDNYDGKDISLKAKKLLQGREIIAMVYQQEPDSIVFCLMSDGTMLTITYVREQQIVAWAELTTKGYFEDIAVLDSGMNDDIYVVVQRYGCRMIEKLKAREDINSTYDANFLDSASVYDFKMDNILPPLPDAKWTIQSYDSTAINSFNENEAVYWNHTVTEQDYGMSVAFSNNDNRNFKIMKYSINFDVPVNFEMVKEWRLAVKYSSGESKIIDARMNVHITRGDEVTFEIPEEKQESGSVFELRFTYNYVAEIGKTFSIGKIRFYGRFEDADYKYSSISGLERFEGKEVTLMCDGVRKEVHTVQNGAVSLVESADKIFAGLSFKSRLRTLNAAYEDKMSGQTIMDCKARVAQVSCKWLNSLPGKIGDTADALDDVVIDGDKPEGAGLYSGMSAQGINSISGFDKSVIYEHTEPTPFTLLLMILKLEIGQE